MAAWTTHIWSWLLRAYPAEFRYEYGPELVAALDERYREERGASRVKFCLAAAGDVIATAAKERYHIMMKDLVHSIRRLVAHPGIAIVAVLSLALGIGANSAMFSVLYASLLRPLPYADLNRRVIVSTTALNSPNPANRNRATSADFIDWRDRSTMLEDWHMFSMRHPTTARGAGLPERIAEQHVTPGLLDSLGVRPVIGRTFRPGEDASRLALISESYWRRRFGAQADVLGKTLNGYTIIGVVPASFELLHDPSAVDFWNTINLSPGSQWISRKLPWLFASARLKPGVSLAHAQSELAGIAANLAQAYPDTNRHRGVVITPIQEAFRGGLGSYMYPLLGAVGFVLLIACSNVANLLLARATARRREMSVRAALGASRDRLMREFLADGVVLAVPGVVAGLAVAYAGIALFRAVAPEGFPGLVMVELNSTVLWFTGAAAALAGTLSALFPALSGSRVDLADSLKEGARGSAGRNRQRLRSVLVAGEIALALILLAGTALTLNSLLRLQNHNLGFDPKNVTVAELNLTGSRYMTDAPPRDIDMRYVEPAVRRFIEHALRETHALPGVESAAFGGNVPMGPRDYPNVGVRVPGKPETGGSSRGAAFNVVTSGFFRTLRIPLLRGRYLTEQDQQGSAWVAVVNETFAREFFPGAEALGQVIHLTAGPEERPREIVGVVADYTQWNPRRPVEPEVHTSHFQQGREIPGNFQGQRFRSKLLVRSSTGAIKPDVIAKIVAGFDKELAVYGVRPLDQYMARSTVDIRFYANTLGLFSAIALVLSAIGIYGLMNYSVTDRFHEIGIRLSLGATRARVVWLIVSSGLKLAGAGILAGGALATTRLLQVVLFGVQPWDPVTFSIVALFLLVIAMTACIIPALRATTIDPVRALRAE